MHSLTDICFICLGNHENLQNLANLDFDQISFMDKLIFCIGEVSHTHIPIFACENCCSELKRSYSFKKMYLTSRNRLESYISQLENIDNLSLKMKLDDTKLKHSCVDIGIKNNKFSQEQTNTTFETRIKIEPGNNSDSEHDDCVTSAGKIFEENNISENITATECNMNNFNEIKLEKVYIKEEKSEVEKAPQGDKKSDELIEKTEDRKKIAQATCSTCSKTFSSRVALKKHKIIHAVVKPYGCPYCDKRFTTSGNMRSHVVIHTGEKPFACELCDKRYPRFDALKFHMAVHTGVRPHVCTECGKPFARRETLKRHMTLHDSNCIFECSECHKKFVGLKNLKMHMILHTGFHACRLCKIGFTTVELLNNHRLQFHSTKNLYPNSNCDNSVTEGKRLDISVNEESLFLDLTGERLQIAETRRLGLFLAKVYKEPYISDVKKRGASEKLPRVGVRRSDPLLALASEELEIAAVKDRQPFFGQTDEEPKTATVTDGQPTSEEPQIVGFKKTDLFLGSTDEKSHVVAVKNRQLVLSPTNGDLQIANPFLVPVNKELQITEVQRMDTEELKIVQFKKGGNFPTTTSEESLQSVGQTKGQFLWSTSEDSFLNMVNEKQQQGQIAEDKRSESYIGTESYDEQSIEKTFMCEECKKKFLALSDLKAHMAWHIHMPVCEKCNLGFAQVEALNRHNEHAHSGETFSSVDATDKESKEQLQLAPNSSYELDRSFANPEREVRFCSSESMKSGQTQGKEDCTLDRFSTSESSKKSDCEKSAASGVEGAAYEGGLSEEMYENIGRHMLTYEDPTGDNNMNCEDSFPEAETILSYSEDNISAEPEESFLETDQLPEELDKPYACNECKKRFAEPRHLKQHMKVHIKPHKCAECNKNFATVKQLDVHKLSHTGEKPHACEECGKRFAEPRRLKQHMQTHSKQYICSECDEGFATRRQVDVHMLSHIGERPYACTECDKRYSEMKYLTRHMEMHNKEAIADQDQMNNSNNGTKQVDSLCRSANSNNEEKKHVCKECGKQFGELKRLTRHMLTHSKPYTCSECSAGFATRKQVEIHKLSHTGERPHACNECGKRFAALRLLKQHMHLHSKLFICVECNSGFSTKDGVEQHKLTHTGERVHACIECDKRFILVKNLKKHIFLVHTVHSRTSSE